MKNLQEGWLDNIVGGAKKLFKSDSNRPALKNDELDIPIANKLLTPRASNFWSSGEKSIQKLAEKNPEAFNAVANYIRDIANSIRTGSRAAMESVVRMEGIGSTPSRSSGSLRERLGLSSRSSSADASPIINAEQIAKKYFPMVKELAQANPEKFLQFADKFDTQYANRKFGSVENRDEKMAEWEAKFLGKKYNPHKALTEKYKNDPLVRSLVDSSDESPDDLDLIPEEQWSDDPFGDAPDTENESQEILNEDFDDSLEPIPEWSDEKYGHLLSDDHKSKNKDNNPYEVHSEEFEIPGWSDEKHGHLLRECVAMKTEDPHLYETVTRAYKHLMLKK
jgi:hypothetical protein